MVAISIFMNKQLLAGLAETKIQITFNDNHTRILLIIVEMINVKIVQSWKDRLSRRCLARLIYNMCKKRDKTT